MVRAHVVLSGESSYYVDTTWYSHVRMNRDFTLF